MHRRYWVLDCTYIQLHLVRLPAVYMQNVEEFMPAL